MMDTWTDRLSEYLDGDLTPAERDALEAHLLSCGVCRETLEQLRRVVNQAQALDDRPINADLWPGVAALIGSEVAVHPRARWIRRVSFSLPELAAAAIALMLLSGGAAAWLVRRPVAAAPVAAGPVAPAVIAVSSPASAQYATAVLELERALQANRGRLDTTTVRIIESKLQLIDRAIGEAQRALEADPGDAYLTGHLTQTRMRKLDLLRRAVTLAAAAS